MGVLAARETAVPDGPGSGGRESPAPEPEGGAPDAADEGEAAKPEAKGEFVPFSAVEKRKTGSRRDRAHAEMEDLVTSKLKPLEDGWKTERDRYQQQIQQQQEYLARLSGQLDAIQRMPPPAPVPKPDAPDPDKLMAEAEKALDERDIRTYHAKVRAAHQAEARRIAEEQVSVIRKDLEAKIPAQVPHEVQYLMARHPGVAMAGPQGIQAVMLKDQELELYRVPRGPQRLAKAFELAEQFLGSVNGQQQRPAYSQDTAQALQGVPTGRPAGASGKSEDGVTLSPLQLQTIKDLGWSKDEYVKWMKPERFVKR